MHRETEDGRGMGSPRETPMREDLQEREAERESGAVAVEASAGESLEAAGDSAAVAAYPHGDQGEAGDGAGTGFAGTPAAAVASERPECDQGENGTPIRGTPGGGNAPRGRSSSRRVRQGDPLGPLLFAAAIQPTLLGTAMLQPEVAVVAYADDITIVGPRGAALEAFETITRGLATVGLRCNISKSSVWCLSGDEGAKAAAQVGLRRSAEGIKPKGAPTAASELAMRRPMQREHDEEEQQPEEESARSLEVQPEELLQEPEQRAASYSGSFAQPTLRESWSLQPAAHQRAPAAAQTDPHNRNHDRPSTHCDRLGASASSSVSGDAGKNHVAASTSLAPHAAHGSGADAAGGQETAEKQAAAVDAGADGATAPPASLGPGPPVLADTACGDEPTAGIGAVGATAASGAAGTAGTDGATTRAGGSRAAPGAGGTRSGHRGAGEATRGAAGASIASGPSREPDGITKTPGVRGRGIPEDVVAAFGTGGTGGLVAMVTFSPYDRGLASTADTVRARIGDSTDALAITISGEGRSWHRKTGS
ncbi:unnamed protein product [Closterium sp. Naga37s-1]|nr:unnamed protein product [Closterium sp. Naga37s-1]